MLKRIIWYPFFSSGEVARESLFYFNLPTHHSTQLNLESFSPDMATKFLVTAICKNLRLLLVLVGNNITHIFPL